MMKEDITHYTVNEVATNLRVTQRTIYTYIKIGKLRGIKIANKWRFSKKHIDDFLKQLSEVEYPRYVKK
ncbi:helix-turn-helix domain-containing protein [Liberiplasma polymorphum]|uniref:helix-turn-helix domain-containing protein n=1 Tax=Liberiplasma polymorphum TaxID=3374570 RepID=UPI0037708525